MELFCLFSCWRIGQFCLGQTMYILLPEFLELQEPFRSTTQVEGLQCCEHMMVSGNNCLDLCADMVKEVLRVCVWGLVARMNVLVSEKACLGSEFCA